MQISARNVIAGTVVDLVKGPVSTEVDIEIAPGVRIVSTITTRSAEALQLAKGRPVHAVIKASSVMVATD